jgi:hypothetical protein
MEPFTLFVAALAGLGTFLGGYTVYAQARDKRRTDPLDLVTEAVRVYVSLNTELRGERDILRNEVNDLRERTVELETDVRRCEDGKRLQGQRIGELEKQVARLTGGQSDRG